MSTLNASWEINRVTSKRLAACMPYTQAHRRGKSRKVCVSCSARRSAKLIPHRLYLASRRPTHQIDDDRSASHLQMQAGQSAQCNCILLEHGHRKGMPARVRSLTISQCCKLSASESSKRVFTDTPCMSSKLERYFNVGMFASKSSRRKFLIWPTLDLPLPMFEFERFSTPMPV